MLTDDREKLNAELRLFLEEICCNICRFEHAKRDGLAPESVRINQEAWLGVPGAYADIRVSAPGRPHYFVEVKYGVAAERIVTALARKYGSGLRGDTPVEAPGVVGASRVVLMVDLERIAQWPEVEQQIRDLLPHHLELEVWSEAHLLDLVREHFGLEASTISEASILSLRHALDEAKGRHAFGDAWVNDDLQSSLLWRFGFWRLRQLQERHALGGQRLAPRNVLPPGLYEDVVVLIADLCCFSSYVRDTRDNDVVHHCLTSFYAKARYEIMNSGGMLYQFVGDEVSGLFGLPDHRAGYPQSALECARALLQVGNSVSHEWQRHIDRVQSAIGVHIGMAVGDVQLVALRPFGRAHLGAVSDSINMAARLCSHAGPGEIVISNTFYQTLDDASQADFAQVEAVDAKNLGRIRAWKCAPRIEGSPLEVARAEGG